MAHGVYKNMKNKLKIHAILLSVAFMNMLFVVTVVLAIIVFMLSFALWTVPPLPPSETVNFTIRVVLAVTAILTAIYSMSPEYKEAVTDYIAK